MISNPWLRLKELLLKEKRYIIKGDLKALLLCIQEKEELLQDPAFKQYPLSPELKEEIKRLFEHNKALLEAGIAFIDEAYRLLGSQMSSSVAYESNGQTKKFQGSQILNGVV